MSGSDPVRVDLERDGFLAVVRLDRPRGNIIDAATIAALDRALEDAWARPSLRAVALAAAGEHFSLGVSVQEHVREKASGLVRAFGALCHRLVTAPVPMLAAVQGRCLGGALEMVLSCHFVAATLDAQFGLPEIRLGVYPPVAAALLEAGLARSGLEDLALFGRTIAATEAHRRGLVDLICGRGQDPMIAVRDHFETHLADLSAASLRVACRALRSGRAEAFRRALAAQERLYVEDLMSTPDANEGIGAFLEKRRPVWRDG